MRPPFSMPATHRPAILLGGGGHARVTATLVSFVAQPNLKIIGICDPGYDTGSRRFGLPVLGGDAVLKEYIGSETLLCNGIGVSPGSHLRAAVQEQAQKDGFLFPACVHPAAWVAPDVILGAGAQIMAGAIVQPGCEIGAGVIVNTGATVDHDCHLADYVHIAPGATLCGEVRVGRASFVGSGSTILPRCVLGDETVVAAGTTLREDLLNFQRYYGLNRPVLTSQEKNKI